VVDDKTTLKRSNAGMRLIAQTTLYNQSDFERLRAYIADYYHSSAIEAQSEKDRLLELKMTYRVAGKLRVHQIVAADKHRVIVMLHAQNNNSLYLAEMSVEEDYPHKVTAYHHQLMGEMEIED
jgi:hypothetical protein